MKLESVPMETDDGIINMMKITQDVSNDYYPVAGYDIKSKIWFHEKIDDYISNPDCENLRLLVYDTFSNLSKLVESFSTKAANGTRTVDLKFLLEWYHKVSDHISQITFLNAMKTLLG
jgi:hypothetical protein